jgi:DnaJ like chaperone protein
MSLWGKIIGGMAGLAFGGGPIGLLLGMALGDRAASTAPNVDALRVAAALHRQDEVFALCVVVLSAKLAKADGVVNRAEIAAFRQHFQVPPQSAREIGRLFDAARNTASGYEPYAEQMGHSFSDRPEMLEDVLAALFAIARADRPVTPPEARFLTAVCHRFGLGQAAWDRAAGALPRPARPAGDAYAVLGLPRDATDEALHQRWRALMRETHPDSLAGRGLGADILARAGERVARINAAWDAIKRERGL